MKTLFLTFFTFVFAKVFTGEDNTDFLDLSDLKFNLEEDDIYQDVQGSYKF
jgi:hypothetical protein